LRVSSFQLKRRSSEVSPVKCSKCDRDAVI